MPESCLAVVDGFYRPRAFQRWVVHCHRAHYRRVTYVRNGEVVPCVMAQCAWRMHLYLCELLLVCLLHCFTTLGMKQGQIYLGYISDITSVIELVTSLPSWPGRSNASIVCVSVLHGERERESQQRAAVSECVCVCGIGTAQQCPHVEKVQRSWHFSQSFWYASYCSIWSQNNTLSMGVYTCKACTMIYLPKNRVCMMEQWFYYVHIT